MVVNENVPDEFRQMKHDLGLTLGGRKVNWALIIELGLGKGKELKAAEDAKVPESPGSAHA